MPAVETYFLDSLTSSDLGKSKIREILQFARLVESLFLATYFSSQNDKNCCFNTVGYHMLLSYSLLYVSTFEQTGSNHSHGGLHLEPWKNEWSCLIPKIHQHVREPLKHCNGSVNTWSRYWSHGTGFHLFQSFVFKKLQQWVCMGAMLFRVASWQTRMFHRLLSGMCWIQK